jgi:hypothetical protein
MKKSIYSLFLGVFFTLALSKLGYAQDVNDVAENVVSSTASLPGLIAALSYLSGLVIGVVAIFKIIDHVNNPTQTALSVPVIRILLAGALFGLPIFAEAALATLQPNAQTAGNVFFDPQDDSATVLTWFAGIAGMATMLTTIGTNFNSLLFRILLAIDDLPGLVAAVAYLLGLVILVSALYKTRDHVENPSQVHLKDAVIRYLTAGALFALPTIFQAMYVTITGGGLGIGGTVSAIITGVSFFYSSEANSAQCGTAFLGVFGAFLGGGTVGSLICNTMVNTIYLPIFFNSIAYLLGLVFGFWGIIKIRDHVIEPSKVALHEGISRLIAGGCFFALPFVISVVLSSIIDPILYGFGTAFSNTGFYDGGVALTCGATNSLDQAMGCFMQDILGPAHVALNFFGYIAGTIFIMIGISRLIKSAQEGPKGPGGIGTFSTFLIGGLLMSSSIIMRAFSSSIFNNPITDSTATLQFTGGMAASETAATYHVINAVLQFLIVLGLISFVRGLFILRDVAEGKGNASTMAGMTHLIGGALAVNMGPLLNAIQQTLGITAFGVTFS